jgi:hypothetical protein
MPSSALWFEGSSETARPRSVSASEWAAARFAGSAPTSSGAANAAVAYSPASTRRRSVSRSPSRYFWTASESARADESIVVSTIFMSAPSWSERSVRSSKRIAPSE